MAVFTAMTMVECPSEKKSPATFLNVAHFDHSELTACDWLLAQANQVTSSVVYRRDVVRVETVS